MFVFEVVTHPGHCHSLSHAWLLCRHREELAALFDRAIGNVSIVSVEVEADTKYPKGAAQVVFSNRESYITAIATHRIVFPSIDKEKEMEIKPYLLDSVPCECCNGRSTRYLCPEVCCLLYLCETCWIETHRQRQLLSHKPMTKGRHSAPFGNISNSGISTNNPNQRTGHPKDKQTCHCSKFPL
ncbi:unnamed protein product [Gongylonema pulchrum]|uniref:CEBP_ZZ domain-containing protein n=1 Tax=Gongylonema pulchrum TaxID=637853 RepID=A0A183EG99_9BILA|nr:unnamed protein product [Gongylonema pulchrum]